MTITFKNSTVFVPREMKVTTRKVEKNRWGEDYTMTFENKISLKPDATDPSKDTVVIKAEDPDITSHTLRGEQIKADPGCKKFAIGWYK